MIRLGTAVREKLRLATAGLRGWSARHWSVALAGGIGTALLLGVATVLIPNPVFGREIPPTPWSYPVWIASSVLAGLLIGTYVSTPGAPAPTADGPARERTSLLGYLGAFGSWFAIGCPVCNKLALLALGYSGALTYFAPIQPWLAAGSVVLLAAALVYRLAGQVACPVPVRESTRGAAS